MTYSISSPTRLNCLKVSVIASYFLRVHLTTLSQSVVCLLCQGTNFLLPKMIASLGAVQQPPAALYRDFTSGPQHAGVNPHIQRPPRPVRI